MNINFAEGDVLLLNKPLEWTSFDAINKIKCLIKHHLGLKKTKIGHAGTLDPLATGLLIVCVGKYTKKIDEYQAQEKEYTGTLVLGKTTPSSDLETKVDAEFPINHINEELINSIIPNFVGEIDQTPPLFSAKKIQGERAYEFARRGDDMVLPSRKVEIKSFEITRIDFPEIDFKVVCSKGTYIRALARDFGKALQSGAYLKALCRTRIGEFKLENAYSLEDLEQIVLNQKNKADNL